MSSFDVLEPMEFHFTPGFLIRAQMQPLIAGDAITWGFQYLDSNGAAVDLTGFTAAWLGTQFDDANAPVVLSRKTGILISGTTMQISFDADQSAEATDVDGNPIGRGWMRVNWRAEDEDAVLAAVPTLNFANLRLRKTGNLPITLLRGDAKALRPRGRLSDIP
jgi:hypothetical protein